MSKIRAPLAIAGTRYALAACALCFMGFPAAPQAQERDVPRTLFGVSLGGVFAFGATDDSKDVGTLPIAEYKGVEQFLGSGISVYFKPLKEYEPFKYSEKRKKPDDNFFATTFRLYLLPVFPKNAQTRTRKNLSASELKWEVTVVEWSESAKTQEDAYFWALDLCKSLQVDLAKKAETFNYYESKWYSCKFLDKNRQLKVTNLGPLKIFSLEYVESIFKQKEAAADAMRRKLQMNLIRPY